MTHFFVSVGTSQLDNDRLFLDAANKVDMERIKKGNIADANNVSRILFEEITSKLLNYWGFLVDRPIIQFDPENQFGAEITTLLFCLWGGTKAGIIDRGNNRTDRFYLLLSDTDAGRLTGRILAWFLVNVWHVEEDLIWMKQAIGLNGWPQTESDACAAVDSFANLLAEALFVSRGRIKVDRQFIVSGGYKSVIPAMDWFSVAYNIPINYIFEEADQPVKNLILPLPSSTRQLILDKLVEIFQVPQPPPINEIQ